MRSRGVMIVFLTLLLAATASWADKKSDKKADPKKKTTQTPPAQTSEYMNADQGEKDTVWIEYRQNGRQIMADIWLANDQPLAGGQIPLRFGNGKAPLVVDSVVWDAKRAGHFDMKNDGVDSLLQTMRIGFIADLSGRRPPLDIGRGKLLTVYFTLKSNSPYDLTLDTLTLSGSYNLLMVDGAAATATVIFRQETTKFRTK